MKEFNSLRSMLTALSGSKLAVARVAEPGHDVGALVEVIIDRGNVDIDLGMCSLHDFDSLGCSNQTHKFDPLHAPTLEDLRGGRCRAACGEHWVQDETDRNARLRRQLIVILHRLERVFIAV